MAKSVEFPGHNRRFEIPKQIHDHVTYADTMFAHSNGVWSHVCWKLSEEELEEVKRTGEVWMAVRCGVEPLRPHFAGSLSWVKQNTIDFAGGMWRSFKPKKPEEPA